MKPQNHSENAILNGLRGLSVMMILTYHCFMLPVLVHYRNKPELLHQYLAGIPNFLQFIFGFDKAVDIFFILSAYLLCNQLLKELNATSRINFRFFYIRRAFRIMPIFLLALFLYSIFETDLYPKLIHNLLFIDNFYHDSIVKVGWSLSIEVQFYAMLPFILLFLYKFKNYRGFRLGILFLTSLAIRYFICLGHPELTSVTWIELLKNPDHVFDAMTKIYTPSHARFGPLILGMGWAFLDNNKRMIERLKQIPVGVNWIILGLSVSLIILTLQFPAYRMDSWVYEYFGTEINIWWLTLHRNLFGVAVMGLVILLNYKIVPGNAGRYLSGLLSHRFRRIPARLSFPMYLFQFPIIFVSSLILFWTTDYTSISHFRLTDIFYIFVIATSITVTISILLHRFIEMPMIRIGKSLTDGT